MGIPYFDAHCDTITKYQPIRRTSANHVDLLRLNAYEPAGQVMDLWAPPHLDGPLMYRRMMLTFRREMDKNKDLALWCRSAADLDRAVEEKKIAILLGVEGGNLLSCSVAGMLNAYEQGVRLVTLVWNEDNRLCGSCNDSGSGLTRDGQRFVKACWDKGMVVDLSHASEQTFWDVMKMAKTPVLVSHSNAKSVWNHPRNLTDAQISEIVHNGGCIGLNLYAEFLGKDAGIDTVLHHIDHFLSMDAAENLCLGTDFDGSETLPQGIAGVQDMARLYEALLQFGIKERVVQDIFYNNLNRFFHEVL